MLVKMWGNRNSNSLLVGMQSMELQRVGRDLATEQQQQQCQMIQPLWETAYGFLQNEMYSYHMIQKSCPLV